MQGGRKSDSGSAAARLEVLEKMKGILAEKRLAHVQFYVRFVDEIMPDRSTGKKPLILAGEAAV